MAHGGGGGGVGGLSLWVEAAPRAQRAVLQEAGVGGLGALSLSSPSLCGTLGK